eukprot:TRINITY_DN2626_c0_g1_i3.p1 TRINITY_DN2626_c0_g1~~TRINITY_DN2626_c0_g1_i3.p1  ORF type:complete len:443 (-),score=89.93 TRINITY_DN2626_c0_g1_i3:392-1720(-)
MALRASTSAAIGASLLLLCPELAEGHAVLLEPPSRNFVANKAGTESCPHCLQSGGPNAVKARGNGIWPTVLDPTSHGLCGDPVQNSVEAANWKDSTYLVPNPVQRTYQAGDIVEFVIGVNAHHKGHYEFRLCDVALDGSTLNTAAEGQACLDKWVLKRAPLDAACGNGNTKADCQPIDTKHPGRWYIPPQSEGTAVGGPEFNVEDLPSAVTEYHVMKYKIPDDLSCTHCTLQWYWATGNTCNYDADYLGPDGYFQRNAAAFEALGWTAADWCPFCVASWANCDNACCKTGGNFGEEFWNCADIAVTGSGSTASTTASTTAATTTTASTTGTTTTESSGSSCSAKAGNTLFATDPKCEEACGYVAAGAWPCSSDGPCACAAASTTTAATTTSAATTATTTTQAAGCGAAWSQCGGNNWVGPTCCVSGLYCSVTNEWYSQCVPN